MSFVVIVDNIRSAHNVGSIFRTADGAGVDKIYLVGVSPTPPTQETVYLTRAHKDLAKTALGAEKNIPWEYYEEMGSIFARLKHDGYVMIALEQSANSEDYRAYQPSEKVALMVGNEVDGVSADVLRQCDVILEIPMRGQKNSLNVSVAFGIASFEIRSKLK
jgi:tRNA G18 (ribose-2'-O)-methylase SpoU